VRKRVGIYGKSEDKKVTEDKSTRSDIKDIIELIDKYPEDYGIIYCSSKSQCDKMHETLVQVSCAIFCISASI